MSNLVKDMFTGYSATETGNWSVTGTATWTTPSQVTIAGTTGIITNDTNTVTDLTNSTHEIIFQSNASGAAVVLKYEVYDGTHGLIIILNQDDTMSINGISSSANTYNYNANTDITVRVLVDNNNVVKVYVDKMPTVSQEGALNSDTTTATIKFSSTTSSINSVIKKLHVVDQLITNPDIVTNPEGKDYTHYFHATKVRDNEFYRKKTEIRGEQVTLSSNTVAKIKEDKIESIFSIIKYTDTSKTVLKQVPSSPSTGEFSFFPPNMIKFGDTATSTNNETYWIEYDPGTTDEKIDSARHWQIQPILDEHFGTMTTTPFGSTDIPDQCKFYGPKLCALMLKINANPEVPEYRTAFNYWLNMLREVNVITVDGVVQTTSHPQIPRFTSHQTYVHSNRRDRQNAYRSGG